MRGKHPHVKRGCERWAYGPKLSSSHGAGATASNTAAPEGHVVARLEVGPVAVDYRIDCNDDGTTRRLTVRCRHEGNQRELILERDSASTW